MTFKKKIGDFGEEIVSKYLLDRNYEILDRNYAKTYGEIDIIAMKDDVLCFVEVKTRKSDKFAYAAEAVNFYKQERIKKASQAYMVENNLTDFLISYDVCEVYLDNRKINYIENAF